MYEERFYRYWATNRLKRTEVVVDETDLLILADTDLDKEYIKKQVVFYRSQISSCIKQYPDFAVSLTALPHKDLPCEIVKFMAENSAKVDVGPMASVAGAIAEFIGWDLKKFCSNIIVENGGDIFAFVDFDLKIGLYAGRDNPVNNMAFIVNRRDYAFGLCSSSSKLGHSLSFGNADLSVVLAKNTAFADALATKLANMVKSPNDISRVVDWAKSFSETEAVLLAAGDKIGIWGDIEIADF